MKLILALLVSALIYNEGFGKRVYPMYQPLSNDMINYINHKANTTWKARSTSRFSEVRQLKSMLGTTADPNNFKLPKMCLTSTVMQRALPVSFDAREAWPHCSSISEIRDQSACGSCWAFGAVGAMSDRICIASNGAHQPRLSAENMVSCCKECGMGCNGGFPPQAWHYWQNHGLVTGDLYGTTDTCQPYSFEPCEHHVVGPRPPCSGEPETPKCSNQCQSRYGTEYEKDKWYGKSAYSIHSDPEHIMYELMKHGPVEVDFEVYADFPNYSSGVYQHVAGGLMGGHAVRLVGWGEENGVKYWLIANSWNNDWGDKGYFKILRGSNECGIESDINAGLPKL